MENETELLPCPFCGGEAESRKYESIYFCQCIQCFGSTSAEYESEDESIAAWNRRLAQPASEAACCCSTNWRLCLVHDAGGNTHPPAPAVPDGYALVPLEPTPEMVAAGQASGKDSPFSYSGCYRAMLAAGKKPGTGQ